MKVPNCKVCSKSAFCVCTGLCMDHINARYLGKCYLCGHVNYKPGYSFMLVDYLDDLDRDTAIRQCNDAETQTEDIEATQTIGSEATQTIGSEATQKEHPDNLAAPAAEYKQSDDADIRQCNDAETAIKDIQQKYESLTETTGKELNSLYDVQKCYDIINKHSELESEKYNIIMEKLAIRDDLINGLLNEIEALKKNQVNKDEVSRSLSNIESLISDYGTISKTDDGGLKVQKKKTLPKKKVVSKHAAIKKDGWK